jgi:hypothetical protein
MSIPFTSWSAEHRKESHETSQRARYGRRIVVLRDRLARNSDDSSSALPANRACLLKVQAFLFLYPQIRARLVLWAPCRPRDIVKEILICDDPTTQPAPPRK